MKIKYWAWFFLILTASCNNRIFNEKPKKIRDIDISKLNYGYTNILVYKSESNATTNESIQLRVNDDNNEKVVKFYERYDVVLNHILEGGSLKLILQDTSGINSRVDTVVFDLSTLKGN